MNTQGATGIKLKRIQDQRAIARVVTNDLPSEHRPSVCLKRLGKNRLCREGHNQQSRAANEWERMSHRTSFHHLRGEGDK